MFILRISFAREALAATVTTFTNALAEAGTQLGQKC